MTSSTPAGGHPDPVFELVDRALRLPAGRRASFIGEFEADPRVRDEALAMLRTVSTTTDDAESMTAEASGGASTLIGIPIGDFSPVRAIGCGAGGIVYEARQRMPRRSVAIKVLRPRAGVGDVALRLEAEARALAALGHPSIVAVHAAGVAEVDGFGPVAWMAMELVPDARTSTEWARASGGAREVVRIFASFAGALGAAHRAGVVHRDVKPANLLVSSTGHAKVVDFGLAAADGCERLPVGTRGYLAPERRDGGAATARSDVWSLGVCLAEALRAARVPRRHPAWAIAAHACAADPEDRYADAASMAADVRALRDGSSIRALRRDPLRAAIHSGAARPRTMVAAASAAAIAGGAAWWSFGALRGNDAMLLLGAQRILSMHGEMTDSIDAIRPADRPAAIERAVDRGMRACGESTLDAEVAFLSASAIIRLGDVDRACEFAAHASRELASMGVPEAERTWIDLLAAACGARSSAAGAPETERLVARIRSIAATSRASDFVLASYAYALALQSKDPGFRALVPEVLGRAGLDPDSSITGTVILLAAAADPASEWTVPGRAEAASRAVDRWTREPFAGYLAPVLAEVMIDVLPACSQVRDLPRFEAIVPALRLASSRTGSTERALLAEAHVAAYERAFGLFGRARATLDAMAVAEGAAEVPTVVFSIWLPERVKLALLEDDPAAAVARVEAFISRAPWVAASEPLLAQAIRACGAGDRASCGSIIGDWIRARPESLTPEQRSDDERMADALVRLAATNG